MAPHSCFHAEVYIDGVNQQKSNIYIEQIKATRGDVLQLVI